MSQISTRSLHKQAGMSPLTMLLLLVIGGFLVLTTLTMAPYYVDFNSVKTIIDGVADEEGIDQMSEGQIATMISKRLRMNQIKGVTVDDFFIETGEETFVGIEYEIREPLIANADVVMKFVYPAELIEELEE